MVRENQSKNAKEIFGMAKINPEAIEGFNEMSAEDKVNALLNFEYETADDIPKLKAAMDHALAETAENKRKANEWAEKYKATLTETQRAEEERKEADKKKDELIAQYEAERRVSSYTKKFVESGYDIETASKMASALPAGVGDEYFAASKIFLETKTKEIESAALSKQPGLSVGSPPTAQQAEAEEMNKMRHYFGLPPTK